MPNKHLQIGITGGIGAGKSIISKVFQVLGISVYDADSRAKWIMNTDEGLKKSIIEIFGKNAYSEGGLNRQHISQIAFGKPEMLKQLNNLVHPKVGEDYASWVKKQGHAPYSLKEAALLFETGSNKSLDKIILVTAPERIRVQRVVSRDSHRSEEDVYKIIEKQWDEEKKARLSDFLINNDSSELVIPQVLQVHNTLLNQA